MSAKDVDQFLAHRRDSLCVRWTRPPLLVRGVSQSRPTEDIKCIPNIKKRKAVLEPGFR
jgi:hypothetical protein